MELREALTQIAEIRQSMARGEVFRGYRAATTAFSGVVAVGTGVVQAVVMPSAEKVPLEYVMLWSGAAAVCLVAVGVEMVVRTRRSASVVQRQLTLLAVEQFVPSVVAGGLLTWGICEWAVGAVWMLPALWMVLFSLGVFASSRILPRVVFLAGGFYLVAGVVALMLGARDVSHAFSPWLMGGVFGVGQMLIGGMLYYRLERGHE
jgi:hypothetical protein